MTNGGLESFSTPWIILYSCRATSTKPTTEAIGYNQD